MFFSKSKNVVGLDIGSSAVKLVELKEKKGGTYSLVKLGIERLSPEAIVDGSIMDSSMVVETISKLNSEKQVKNSNYATSLSGHSVIIKKIALPAMSPEELAESIQWEAEQYIPFDINDVNLDYVPLSAPGTGDNVEVILVAVKKEKINDYTSVISQTGKLPMLVDVDAFALQNCYEMNNDVDEDKVLALVNIGASVTNVNVLSGSSSLFWRDITFGGNQYTDAIQRELSLSFEQAEELKRGRPQGDYTIQQVIPILNSVSEDFAGELRKTLDFFTATSGAERVDEIVLAGGGSGVLNLDAILRDKFGMPVSILDPFRRVSVDESEFNPEELAEIAPSMAIAVGLAIRKLGDA
ncbi:MAG TPA: type IV pilus assembly protein PilM [Thermoanaerobaculia bacterium]|nr:type IV pilus assembly protein PilM [Thermoanaerobaculia bacterium]